VEQKRGRKKNFWGWKNGILSRAKRNLGQRVLKKIADTGGRSSKRGGLDGRGTDNVGGELTEFGKGEDSTKITRRNKKRIVLPVSERT